MANTYEPIATQTLASDAGIITFSSIPQTYTDLLLVASAKSSAATYDITAIRVNSVTSGYSKTYLEAGSSGASAGRGTAEISLRAGYLPGTNYANEYTIDEYRFMDYTNTTNYKNVICRCTSSNTSTNFKTQYQISLIPTTNAITQITFQTANGSNIKSGSTFTLFGIKAA